MNKIIKWMYPLLYWEFYMHIFFFLFLMHACEVGAVIISFSDDELEAQRNYVPCSRAPVGKLECALGSLFWSCKLLETVPPVCNSLLCLLKKPCALWLIAFVWLPPFSRLPTLPPFLKSFQTFLEFFSNIYSSVKHGCPKRNSLCS